MTQNLKKNTRLDLDAPLLSVRRHAVPPAVKPVNKLEGPATVKSFRPSWRSAAPFYNSELKSGPVHKPGVVPFIWEQKPGQPKAGSDSRQLPLPVPVLPPGRIPKVRDPNGPSRDPINLSLESADSIRQNKAMEMPKGEASEEFLKEQEDNFSDAVETLSRTESFFMNCSDNGFSGVPWGSFSTDPQGRALMMDRFLPAAEAIATSSSQCPPRKPAKLANRVENREYGQRREPLPYQQRPNFVARYPNDEIDSFDGGDYNYEDNDRVNGHFTSKACGLLPLLCLKSSLCLLNPMSGVKFGGRRPLPPPTNRKISTTLHSNVPLSQAEDKLWESVYKLKQNLRIPQGEGERKGTSKSNQPDLQTLDGSSSCRGSREAAVEIVKSDMREARKDGSESFDKDGERFWEISSSHGSLQGSSVYSPTVVEDIHVDSCVLPGIPHSIHSSTGSGIDFKSLKETHKSANIVSILEECNGSVLQPKASGILESDMELYSERSAPGGAVQWNAIEHVSSKDFSLFLKERGQSKNNSNSLHSILPPPLPITPSESWLSRVLPSVSAKIPLGHSILDIQSPHRKQAFFSSCTDSRQESDGKPLESQCPKINVAVPKQKIPANLCEVQQCQIRLIKVEEQSVEHCEPQCDGIPHIKPSKPEHRHIRFSDVLMMPLSPRSEM